MAEIRNGMVVSVPLHVIDVRDASNIRCLAGTRMVLMERGFLEGATGGAEAPTAPPDATAALLSKVQELAEAVAVLRAKVGD